VGLFQVSALLSPPHVSFSEVSDFFDLLRTMNCGQFFPGFFAKIMAEIVWLVWPAT
jgi:hypothetical protein